MHDSLKISEILQMEQCFKKNFGFNLMKPEAKIILTLKQKGSLSIKEAMTFLDLSYRGFYILVRKLENSGVIYLKDDPHDKRVKRIFLSNGDLSVSHVS